MLSPLADEFYRKACQTMTLGVAYLECGNRKAGMKRLHDACDMAEKARQLETVARWGRQTGSPEAPPLIQALSVLNDNAANDSLITLVQ